MNGVYYIAAKNLLRKKTRTALTLAGIGLSSWVLASLLGFNAGYKAALDHDIDNMGFQVLLTAKGCPYEAATLMLKGGTGLRYMDQSFLAKVNAEPEVDRTAPMLMHAVFDPDKGESGGMTAYLGVGPDSFPAMKPYFEFKQGGWFRDPAAYEAVLGYEAAELEQREVGDKMLIPDKNIEIKVVGIIKRTGTQDDGTIYMPLQTVQKIFGKEGKLTGIGIRVKKGAPVAKLEEKLYDLPDVQVVSMAQVKSTIMNLLASAKAMVFAIAAIAVLIAMAGVVNTVLMSVFERYEEIGILKSMGAMPSDVFRLILAETGLLCLFGGAVGVAGAMLLSRVTEIAMRHFLLYAPNGRIIDITPSVAAGSFAAVVAAGLLSGLYPAWRAASVRPLEAIRGEGV